jgi:hypothetical protein
MSKISKSPERNTFQKERYLARKAEAGETPSQEYVDMFESFSQQKARQEADPAWQQHNLEYDLRSTPWICDKVRTSDAYAQNLYAAMCNQDWQQIDVMPILRDQRWSCSWRHAGGIIANMRESGDYIDWYCSGIGSAEEGFGLGHASGEGYVPEGQVTEEIEADLRQLGWMPVEYRDE